MRFEEALAAGIGCVQIGSCAGVLVAKSSAAAAECTTGLPYSGFAESRRRCVATGRASRRFRERRYRTLTSWSRVCRVVGKADWLPGLRGGNPRLVVINVRADQVGAQALNERVYCGRGDMENKIKRQQLWLFAERTSTATMRANRLRLTFSTFAGVLMTLLRQVGLHGTALVRAQADTILTQLLKICARIAVSRRRVRIASVYPLQQLFAHVLAALRAPPASPETPNRRTGALTRSAGGGICPASGRPPIPAAKLGQRAPRRRPARPQCRDPNLGSRTNRPHTPSGDIISDAGGRSGLVSTPSTSIRAVARVPH